MNHIMIDWETTDTKQSAQVVSVGLVEFDFITGKTGREWYQAFDLKKGINRFRTSSDDTMRWWNSLPEHIRTKAFSGEANINDFLEWLPSVVTSRTRMWGNGASFDVSILDNLYEQAKLPIPYKFWYIQDVRTVVELARGIVDKTGAGADAHDPIVDCKNQINYICKMREALRNGR